MGCSGSKEASEGRTLSGPSRPKKHVVTEQYELKTQAFSGKAQALDSNSRPQPGTSLSPELREERAAAMAAAAETRANKDMYRGIQEKNKRTLRMVEKLDSEKKNAHEPEVSTQGATMQWRIG
ncbi:hypothetical protein BB560_001579 [Smittium megazygosporum]|uniref:Uncharacterized protein n=1 Tax=Smittium megazygosporum TaxID=133381 RepID=A0A2T9ZHC0_9FUNG|nr:hypothetical protein BB560_001579 [Smittium megazygosporum]